MSVLRHFRSFFFNPSHMLTFMYVHNVHKIIFSNRIYRKNITII